MARSAVRLISLDVTNTIIRVRGGVGGVYKTIANDFSLLHDTSADEISTQFREIFHEQWKKQPNFGYGSISVSIGRVKYIEGGKEEEEFMENHC